MKDLREAFQKGYSTEGARREPEFKSLQSRPEFAKLLAEFSCKKGDHPDIPILKEATAEYATLQ